MKIETFFYGNFGIFCGLALGALALGFFVSNLKKILANRRVVFENRRAGVNFPAVRAWVLTITCFLLSLFFFWVTWQAFAHTYQQVPVVPN